MKRKTGKTLRAKREREARARAALYLIQERTPSTHILKQVWGGEPLTAVNELCGMVAHLAKETL